MAVPNLAITEASDYTKGAVRSQTAPLFWTKQSLG